MAVPHSSSEHSPTTHGRRPCSHPCVWMVVALLVLQQPWPILRTDAFSTTPTSSCLRGRRNYGIRPHERSASGLGTAVGTTAHSKAAGTVGQRKLRLSKTFLSGHGESGDDLNHHNERENANNNGEEQEEDECFDLEECVDGPAKEKRRMEIVRSLQQTFYESPSPLEKNVIEDASSSRRRSKHPDSFSQSTETTTATSTPSSMSSIRPDTLGGMSLPLWRVPWTEVPGRTNVLSVHEPIYTHMFEGLLRDADRHADEWYFGHVYSAAAAVSRPKDASQTEPLNRIVTWKDALEQLDMDGKKKFDGDGVDDDESTVPSPPPQGRTNDVLGTLMRITDYRRMSDGKLLLLVQALERFVVTDVVQERPYGVARVQLLPDREEIKLTAVASRSTPATPSTTARPLLFTESMVQPARAEAVQHGWTRWHPYEYEATPLALPETSALDVCQVTGESLAKVLPYAPFCAPDLPTTDVRVSSTPTRRNQRTARSSDNGVGSDLSSLKPMEVRMLESGILQEADIPESLLSMPMAELEVALWLVLNDFLVSSRTPVSPVLLGLLPPRGDVSWPDYFMLERIADTLAMDVAKRDVPHKYVRVASSYPALRRQKRLSYAAAKLLEEPDDTHALRHALLQLPSTKSRLAYTLWQFESSMGEFQ